MNDVIFNNDIKVTVAQSPEIAADGDTVEFSATPELLFATDNRTEIQNYNFTYIWMVSYDGGLTYKKIGDNTDKLVLENINAKVFNSSIYKVKVVLEDLEDFLLTENGDRILTQIGEILLFNSQSTALSIQSDPITNDTTVASIGNLSDTTNTPLDFLSVEGTVDEALVFDGTITQEVRAEILSLQSKIDINNQAKSVDGEVSENTNLPSTPETDIVLPNESLSIQADCHVAIKRTVGSSPVIQYEVCKPGGSSGLLGLFNCGDNNDQTEDFNSLTECTNSGACDSEIDAHCEFSGEVAATIPNIQYNYGNDIAHYCCDEWNKVCDDATLYDSCLKEHSSTPVGQEYKGPCPGHCWLENFVPSPPYFLANHCSGIADAWASGAISAAQERDDYGAMVREYNKKLAYCQRTCKGLVEGVSLDLDQTVVSSLTSTGGVVLSSVVTLGGAGAATAGVLFWGTAHNIAGIGAAGLLSGGAAVAILGLVGAAYYSYTWINSGIRTGTIRGNILVNTGCNSDGNAYVGRDFMGAEVYVNKVENAVIKKCTRQVCRQKYTCKGRTDDGAVKYFNRVELGKGPQLKVSEPSNYRDLPNGAKFKYQGKVYEKISVNTVKQSYDSIPVGQTYEFDGQQYTKIARPSRPYSESTTPSGGMSAEWSAFYNSVPWKIFHAESTRSDGADYVEYPDVISNVPPDAQVDGIVILSDNVKTNLNIKYTEHNTEPKYNCDIAGASIFFRRRDNSCEWIVTKKCCPIGKNCTWTVDPEFKKKNPGQYNQITLNATNRTIDTSRLYSINRGEKPLDFIEVTNRCKSKCSGEGCAVYEKWHYIGIDTHTPYCNMDFEILGYQEIEHDGHGKNRLELIVAFDDKCTDNLLNTNTRTIKVAKIVKRYSYEPPTDSETYAGVLIEVYRRLGFRPGDREVYFNAYLLKYEEMEQAHPPGLLDDPSTPIAEPEYFKEVKKVRFPSKTEYLYRHSVIVLSEMVSLNRNCRKCEPVYYLSGPFFVPYPCNDRNYELPFCTDQNNNPITGPNLGNCLKDNSNKTTPIRAMTVIKIMKPSDNMIRELDNPNGRYFNTSGEAQAKGLSMVGSVGLVCADGVDFTDH